MTSCLAIQGPSTNLRILTILASLSDPAEPRETEVQRTAPEANLRFAPRLTDGGTAIPRCFAASTVRVGRAQGEWIGPASVGVPR